MSGNEDREFTIALLVDDPEHFSEQGFYPCVVGRDGGRWCEQPVHTLHQVGRTFLTLWPQLFDGALQARHRLRTRQVRLDRAFGPVYERPGRQFLPLASEEVAE
jgi:hypothetical protein